jgi:hypothetical protein
LRIIAERHRRAVYTQIEVIDPASLLAGLGSWPLICCDPGPAAHRQP